MQAPGRRRRTARLLATLLAVFGAGAFAVPQAFAGAVIDNGTIRLGVNDGGDLNFSGPFGSGGEPGYFGVNYIPTGNDGTRAGCACEGWGAGNAAGADGGLFEGGSNQSTGENENLEISSFSADATTARSVATIDDKLEVTHEFAPSPETKDLYEVKVTLTNIGTARLGDVRYTRLMDWDIEPTPFDEFVTIKGWGAKQLLHSNDNGFANPLVLRPHGPLDADTQDRDVVDSGPDDHGALFDFGFGALDAGRSTTFSIFYGAAATETEADAAVSAAALEVFSYGQPNEVREGGPTPPPSATLGTPNTFIFGFRAVGGKAVIPPSLTVDSATGNGPVGATRGITATLRDSSGAPVPGSAIAFVVSGANPQPSTTVTTDAAGRAAFSYVGRAAGTDTITVCLDSDADGACGADEVVATASQEFTGGPPATPPTQSIPVFGSTPAGPVTATAPSTAAPGDADGDGVPDADDSCPGAADGGDADKDGIADGCDTSDGAQAPVLAKSVNVRVTSGEVFVKLPAGTSRGLRATPKGFRPLKGAESIPIGATVDASKGVLQLTSSKGTEGGSQVGTFYQGIFAIRQKRARKATTDLVLSGGSFKGCGTGAIGASAAAKQKAKKPSRKVVRSLWGKDAGGRFKTVGRHSAGTVRGTRWLTQDRCDGTLTRVTQGKVAVRDIRLKKTVVVSAGQSYLARARTAVSRAKKSARKGPRANG